MPRRTDITEIVEMMQLKYIFGVIWLEFRVLEKNSK